jgi:hypothetical protein
MIEALIVIAIGGICALMARTIHTTNERNSQSRQDYAPLRDDERVELACVGMCIASRDATLTGRNWRESDRQTAEAIRVERQLYELCQGERANRDRAEVVEITAGRWWTNPEYEPETVEERR